MRAENERLRHEHLAEVASLRSEHGAEVASLRAEHGAEVASLRAEVASLHAQLGIKGAEDDEDLELGAEAMHMAAPPPSGSCHTHRKGHCKTPTKKRIGKRNKEFLSSECVISRAFWKKVASSVLSVGTPQHPKWQFGKVKGAWTVECPCHQANGGTLDAETALRRIFGQVVLCKRNRV